MGTKTIGLRDDVYERLKARKREEESFTDLVGRLLEDATADWQDGFGTLPEDEAVELEAIVERSREDMSSGLEKRQIESVDELSEAGGETDETA